MATRGRATTSTTKGGTKARTTPAGADNPNTDPEAAKKFPTLPPLPSQDADDDEERTNQEAEAGASKLEQARRLFTDQLDATQQAVLVAGGGDMPSTAGLFVPAEAKQLPPAAQGQIAVQVGVMASQLQANQVAARVAASGVVHLGSRGASPDTVSVVEPERIGNDYRVRCPNCGRSWEYQLSLAGGTIPCQCGQEVAVPYPGPMQEAAPSAESAREDADVLAETFPTPDEPPIDPEAESEERERMQREANDAARADAESGGGNRE